MSQARFQLKTGQLIGGALLTGIAGGLLALAVSALAGSALVAAVRRRAEQIDVPPSAMARQNLARAKAATAGIGAWRDGHLATQPQSN
jgi:hypothetical protein